MHAGLKKFRKFHGLHAIAVASMQGPAVGEHHDMLLLTGTRKNLNTNFSCKPALSEW